MPRVREDMFNLRLKGSKPGPIKRVPLIDKATQGVPFEALFAVRAALFGPIVVAQGPRQ